jgi:intracellular multiplication protein IcmE
MSTVPPPATTPKKHSKLAYALDPKNRIKTLMFLGTAVLSLGLIVFYFHTTSDVSVPAKVNVGQAPGSVKFTNGAKSTPAYTKLYNQNQNKKAALATKNNTSYVPGFLGQTTNSALLTPTAKPAIPQKAMPQQVSHTTTNVNPQVSQQQAQVAAQQRTRTDVTIEKEMGYLQADWKPSNINVVNSRALRVVKSPSSSATTGKSGTPATKAKETPQQIAANVVIGAGRLEYGVVETALNSNRPTPVLGQIEDGPLAGTRLLGAFTTEDNRLVIKFTMASLKNGISFPVDAIMVNPKVNQGYLASSVNHHYFYRYSMLLGGAFLQGFGQTLMQSGSTVSSGYGGVTQTFSPKSTSQAAMAAMGQVGQTVGQIGQQAFSTPNTVRINIGTGVGILFLKPITKQDILGKNGTGKIGTSSGQKGAQLGQPMQPVSPYGAQGQQGYGAQSYNSAPQGLNVVSAP